ncbi:MAG: carboxypeptidase regulatory-like domain-containing protein [Myxococcaceae bacterium]|nr:carboxypeptidase regulatory-like domain-containing protein [Myxococcaceae bacterium]
MFRRVVVASVVGLLVLALAWLVGSGDDERDERAAEARAAEATPEADPGQSPRPAPVRPGSITGVVRHEGRGVARARVSVKATAPLTVDTLDDGAFRIDGLPREPVFLAAASANLASGVVGPLVVEPGQTLEGIVLELGPTISLEGTVRDLVTRAPISRAVVSWSGGTTQTTEAGTFQLPAPTSQVWLEVLARGYLPRTEWLSLELARAGGRLDLALSPVSTLEGTVVEQGTPRSGVSVWAEFTEGLRRGERTAVGLTDAKGQFRLECSEGLRRLVAVTPAGVTVAGPEVRVAVGEARKDLVIELGDLGGVSGIVRRAGQPLASASLTLVNAFNEDAVASTSTLFDGRFSLQAVPVGRYLVQVRAGAFSTIVGPFDHRDDGQPWTIDVAEGQVLEGRVEPPAAGVAVRWRTGDWAGPATQTTTAADGTFRFEGVPAGALLLDAEGLEGAATATAKAGDPVVLRLARGAVVVRVVDQSGAPVADAVVLARSDETGAVRKYVLMAPDGVFQLELPRGRWVVLAEVQGRGRTAGQVVTVAGAPVEVTLSLTATNPVSGRVLDKASRQPLQGARVRAESSMGRVSVLTDARGAFTLPPQPSQVTVIVGRDGYEPQGFWLPSRPDASNLTVELAPSPNRTWQDETPRFEGVGMTLDGRTGRVIVQLVNEGSPAERAGVLAGDVIMTVDGAPAGPDLPAVVNRIRGPAGTPVRIGFERNGRAFEVVMRRKSLLITAW